MKPKSIILFLIFILFLTTTSFSDTEIGTDYNGYVSSDYPVVLKKVELTPEREALRNILKGLLKKESFDKLPKYLKDALNEKSKRTGKDVTYLDLLEFVKYEDFEDVIWMVIGDANNNKTNVSYELLKDTNKEKVIYVLLGGLFNPDPRVRLACIEVLKAIGPHPVMQTDVELAMYMETVGNYERIDPDFKNPNNPKDNFYPYYLPDNPNTPIYKAKDYPFLNLKGATVYKNPFKEMIKLTKLIYRVVLVYRIEQKKDLGYYDFQKMGKDILLTLFDKIETDSPDIENDNNVPVVMYTKEQSGYSMLINNQVQNLSESEMLGVIKTFSGGLTNQSQSIRTKVAEFFSNTYKTSTNNIIKSEIKSIAEKFDFLKKMLQ